MTDRISFKATTSSASMDLIDSDAPYLTDVGIIAVWHLFEEVKRHNAQCAIGVYSYVSRLKREVSGRDVTERLAAICATEGARSASRQVLAFDVVRSLEQGASPIPGVTRALAATGQSFYSLYLASPAWKRIRKEALERAGYRCQMCKRGGPGWIGVELQVHHQNYERLGREEPGDLLVVCKDCHRGADVARRREDG